MAYSAQNPVGQLRLEKRLFEKISFAQPTKKFVVNNLAHRKGFDVLRTPVAHCELNPIELAWAQVKGYLRKKQQNVQAQRSFRDGTTSVRFCYT